MTSNHYTLILLKAQHIDMVSALDWINAQLKPLVDAQTLARSMILIEELYANTIDHGYRWECAEPVELGYCLTSETLNLIYADCAPEFDVRKKVSPSGRDIGGNGLFLIQHLPVEIDYQRKDGWNRIVLKLNYELPGKTDDNPIKSVVN